MWADAGAAVAGVSPGGAGQSLISSSTVSRVESRLLRWVPSSSQSPNTRGSPSWGRKAPVGEGSRSRSLEPSLCSVWRLGVSHVCSEAECTLGNSGCAGACGQAVGVLQGSNCHPAPQWRRLSCRILGSLALWSCRMWGRTRQGTEVTVSFLCFSCPDNPCWWQGSARAPAPRAAGCGCSWILERFPSCDVLIVRVWVAGFRRAERGHSLDRQWPGIVLG